MKRTLKKTVSFLLTLVMILCLVPVTQPALAADNSIADGFYTICSSLNNKKVVDVKDRSTANGNNVQLHDANATVAQVFYIRHVGNGYYAIVMAGTQNKALDIHGGTGYSGANVEVYDYHGGDNQLWKFVSTGKSGEYYIVSKSGGYYLDVAGAATANGTNIQVYSGNQSNAQRFKLRENYNASKAVTYAQKWTDTSGGHDGYYNTEYNIYKKPNPLDYWGYDCTNFVSQCLYTGGMITTSSWGRVTRGANYNKVAGGVTWVQAKSLYRYLKDLGYHTENVKSNLGNIHLGDIVFFDFDGDGTGDHGTICTKISNGVPQYCAHSSWRKNYHYNTSQWSGGKAYVVHMSFCTQNFPQVNLPASTSEHFYPACASNQTSIVNALNSIGVDSSYNFRKQIAAANGISGYSGTAAQNTQLLNLLKAGTLKKPGSSSAPTVSYFPRYTGSSNSLVTGLNSVGADSSYAYRKQVAAANGISNYSGTAAQNTQLLNWLKDGTLKKP